MVNSNTISVFYVVITIASSFGESVAVHGPWADTIQGEWAMHRFLHAQPTYARCVVLTVPDEV
jgi:hypothetical protein